MLTKKTKDPPMFMVNLSLLKITFTIKIIKKHISQYKVLTIKELISQEQQLIFMDPVITQTGALLEKIYLIFNSSN